MIIYTIGKRIKNFVRVKIFSQNKEAPPLQRTKEFRYTTYNDSEIKEGAVKWYHKNGNLKAECYYTNNKLEGLSIFYYPDGTTQAKENYKNGELDGLSKRYYESGNVMSEEYYKNGKILFKRVINLECEITTETNYD